MSAVFSFTSSHNFNSAFEMHLNLEVKEMHLSLQTLTLLRMEATRNNNELSTSAELKLLVPERFALTSENASNLYKYIDK